MTTTEFSTEEGAAVADEDLTEVTLTLVTDDGSDYRDLRDLTAKQLTDLLLAFDTGEVDEDLPDEEDRFREMTLQYAPAEYGGRLWEETRHFTDDAAARLLRTFEDGAPV
ncbi:hypothetical protein [Streptomyces sp. TLI_171]|uniref:hypothetical protein n=1 Tax=Streptomyces sp. TLI_171 TaxID=1938859 RepID=UPI000C18D53A|nr:hypothetical protein [Streptomyces sp. TLI_171]RKE02937.1 hypothetical protein BX266_7540 [Streptomyces sp. TLI_171]